MTSLASPGIGDRRSWTGGSFAEHCLRAALSELERSGALVRPDPDWWRANRALALIHASRPWPDRAWRLAMSLAERLVRTRSPVGTGASILLIPLVRESGSDEARVAAIAGLVAEGIEADAAWARELNRAFRFRQSAQSGEAQAR